MNIEEANQQIIDSIINSVHKGPDEAVEFTAMNYNNSNNDFFLPSRGFAEKVLFRTFEYVCFHMYVEEGIDYSRYVLDDKYSNPLHTERLKSFDTELANSYLEEGSNNYHAGNIENAVEAYKKAAYLGNAKAMYEYGLFQCDGEGCDKDEFFGSFWYWEAAHCRDVRAMYNLGINYRNGAGVRQNMSQMLYWYAMSASYMCKEAIYSLGLSLADGEFPSGENSEEIGLTLMSAASDIAVNGRAMEFVDNNCRAIIDILKESGKIYNL